MINTKLVPIRKQESLILCQEPIHHILPSLLSELSFLETLLSKKAALHSSLDLTNDEAQQVSLEAQSQLDVLIERVKGQADGWIKLVMPKCNTSVSSCTVF